MSRTILGTTSVVLVLAVIGAVCAHGSPAASDGSPLGGPFIGTYTAKLSMREAIARGDGRMTGRFRLELRRNGTYTVVNPLDGATTGRLAVLAGKRLRFFRDSGCVFGGFERPKGGIYAWSVSGDKLSLRLVSEGPCTGRTQSLTYVVWNRR